MRSCTTRTAEPETSQKKKERERERSNGIRGAERYRVTLLGQRRSGVETVVWDVVPSDGLPQPPSTTTRTACIVNTDPRDEPGKQVGHVDGTGPRLRSLRQLQSPLTHLPSPWHARMVRAIADGVSKRSHLASVVESNVKGQFALLFQIFQQFPVLLSQRLHLIFQRRHVLLQDFDLLLWRGARFSQHVDLWGLSRLEGNHIGRSVPRGSRARRPIPPMGTMTSGLADWFPSPDSSRNWWTCLPLFPYMKGRCPVG